jgi:hypothetical protein
MKASETSLTFKLPPEDKLRLEAYGQEHDAPVSQILRRLVREFLAKLGEQK